MTNTIFSFFMFAVLIFGWSDRRPSRRLTTFVWIFVSLLAFAQVGQHSLWAVLGLLVVQEILLLVHRRVYRLDFPLFPLLYAAVLLIGHGLGKTYLAGFSYLVLSSSLDLWARMKEAPGANARASAFNLLSYPKLAVGPITSGQMHELHPPNRLQIFTVGFWGIFKAFILANAWLQWTPNLAWDQLTGAQDYLWFGAWNYVHLYLEFSGACDVVAATFWLFGFGCPLNFDKPWISFSVTEFWKRWHITLGWWIRDHVFIPFGGSRVGPNRLLLNLIGAMLISGLWHGLAWNYVAWGLLQGVFLAGERILRIESRLATAPPWQRAGHWFVTQALVTLSWVVFFAKF